jgi:hypothetical protein
VGRSSRTSWFHFFELPRPRRAAELPAVPATSAAIGFFHATRHRTRIRWYFAPAGAKPLAGGTIFAGTDHNTLAEDCQVIYGEIPGAENRVYNKGHAPAGATGNAYCGESFDWLHPHRWEPHRHCEQRGATNLLLCCNVALGSAIGFKLPAGFPSPLVLTATNAVQDATRSLTFCAQPSLSGFLYLSPKTFDFAQSAIQLQRIDSGAPVGTLAMSSWQTQIPLSPLVFTQAVQVSPLKLSSVVSSTGSLELLKDASASSSFVELSHFASSFSPLELSHFASSFSPLELAQVVALTPIYLTTAQIGAAPLELTNPRSADMSYVEFTNSWAAFSPVELAAPPIQAGRITLGFRSSFISYFELRAYPSRASFLTFTNVPLPAMPLVISSAEQATLSELVIAKPAFQIGYAELVSIGLSVTPIMQISAHAQAGFLSFVKPPDVVPDYLLLGTVPGLDGPPLQLAGRGSSFGPLQFSTMQVWLDELIFVGAKGYVSYLELPAFASAAGIGQVELTTPPILADAVELTAPSAPIQPSGFMLALDAPYGVNAQVCPNVESPRLFSAQVSAAGYPFDGLIFALAGSYNAGSAVMEWRGISIAFPGGNASVDVDSDDSSPGNLLVAFLATVSGGNYYDIGLVQMPIASCNPWSWTFTYPLRFNGSPTGDNITISLVSIP